LTLRSLGERKIIDLFVSKLEKKPDLVVPFGDDVSAIDIGGGRLAVLKTDMLVGRTDIPPGMSLRQAAFKAIVMNVSDFAAKGVKPLVALISLGVPSTYTEGDLNDLAAGLSEGARKNGIYIIGGDTNEADDLIIACMVFGICKRNELILRSGARPGDILVVSGLFGKTAAGLKILLNKYQCPVSLRRKLIDAVYTPSARLDFGLNLKKLGATAAIDSSDGLAWSLFELSRASNVGFTVTKLPVATEAISFSEITRADLLELVFYGGEEYEIIATMDPEKFRRSKRKLGDKVIEIGFATCKKELIYLERGLKRKIEAKGWEHFKTNETSD
jgi:thiamine-monophosphate kinase